MWALAGRPEGIPGWGPEEVWVTADGALAWAPNHSSAIGQGS